MSESDRPDQGQARRDAIRAAHNTARSLPQRRREAL